MDSNTQSIENLGIKTVRVLSADAVKKANWAIRGHLWRLPRWGMYFGQSL